jgi:hypothetical protein
LGVSSLIEGTVVVGGIVVVPGVIDGVEPEGDAGFVESGIGAKAVGWLAVEVGEVGGEACLVIVVRGVEATADQVLGGLPKVAGLVSCVTG